MHRKTSNDQARTVALRSISLLAISTLLLSACGGGGDSEAPPPVAVATPAVAAPAPAPAPAPARARAPDVSTAKLLDLALCPVGSPGRSTDWYKTCLVNKRLVGKTPDNSRVPTLPQNPVVPCAVTLRQDGVFDFIKDGVVVMTTPPFARWFEPAGAYGNAVGSDGQRTFSATLSGVSDPNPNSARQVYNLSIQVSHFPNLSPAFSALTVSLTVSGAGAGAETCELPFNLGL
jgi:hypothetical protein